MSTKAAFFRIHCSGNSGSLRSTLQGFRPAGQAEQRHDGVRCTANERVHNKTDLDRVSSLVISLERP
ncbi:MAG: hypothetical protein M5R41_06840 [Bacteroidia bacterium]|nr:hypothetical protein [Bacteroidia bacterium]